MDELVHVVVDDTQVNQRNRPAGLAAQAKLLVGVELFGPGRKLRETEYGARFRHPVTDEHVDAPV